jgi:hypothetical protein
VARDRSSGATLTARIDSRSEKHIGNKLIPVLSKDVLLCSDCSAAYAAIGRKLNIEVRSVPAKVKKIGVYQVNNVNAYDSRLRRWMHRFHGVATKNLDAYLGCHRLLDKHGVSLTGKSLVAGSLAFH